MFLLSNPMLCRLLFALFALGALFGLERPKLMPHHHPAPPGLQPDSSHQLHHSLAGEHVVRKYGGRENVARFMCEKYIETQKEDKRKTASRTGKNSTKGEAIEW